MRKFILFVVILLITVSITALAQATPTADLAVSQTQSINPVVAGTSFGYQITVRNNGPDAANNVQLVNTLAPGLVHQSNSAACVQAPQRTLTCNLGFLASGDSRIININAFAPADLVQNAGASVIINNQAVVSSVGSTDPNMTNNSVTLTGQVVAAADLSVVSLEIVDAPDVVEAGESFDITLHTVISNAGWSAPIDVAFTSSATASNESLIEPAAYDAEELSLGVNETRSLEHVYTITCQPGENTFTFTNEVHPLRAGDTDRNPENNSATVELTVSCEVAVVIDIRPDDPNNNINLRSNGEIPVGIMSNPELGFDATTLDPATIFLAGAPVARTGNGRYKIQERDLNDDGVLDLLVHIETEDLQLSPSDTEATLVGITEDGLAIEATDEIRIVGNNNGNGNGNSNGNSNGNGNGNGNSNGRGNGNGRGN